MQACVNAHKHGYRTHTSPVSAFCHAGTDIMAMIGLCAAVGMSAERRS